MNDTEASKIYDKALDLSKKWVAVLKAKNEWEGALEEVNNADDNISYEFLDDEIDIIDSFLEPMLPGDKIGNEKDDIDSLIENFDYFAEYQLHDKWLHRLDTLPKMSKNDEGVEDLFFNDEKKNIPDYGMETLKAYSSFSKTLTGFVDELSSSKKTDDERDSIVNAIITPLQKTVKNGSGENAVKLASTISENLDKIM